MQMDSHHLTPPTSPTKCLKRLVKSASKNALRLASTFSPRRHHAASYSPLSFDSLPRKSSCEEGKASDCMLRDTWMPKELCAVFRHLDADGDGKISWVELKTALNSVGEDVGEDELQEIVQQLDSDGDGSINMEEFIRFNTEERGAEEAEKELAAVFRMFEGGREGGGGISPVGLHRMMCRLGVGVGDDGLTTVEHCNFIVSQLDLDGDGVVNFQEFKRMMTAAVH